MKRTATGLCVAAAFGFVASIGAQTPPTPTAVQPPAASSRDANDISITGCLQRGADGKFILANARLDTDMNRSSSTGSTAGSTAGTTGSATSSATATTGGSATSSTAAAMDTPKSWTLEGGQDLDKHVGHKVQVTGRAATGTAAKDDDAAKAGASGGAGSTATTGTTGTTGATATGAGLSEDPAARRETRPRG